MNKTTDVYLYMYTVCQPEGCVRNLGGAFKSKVSSRLPISDDNLPHGFCFLQPLMVDLQSPLHEAIAILLGQNKIIVKLYYTDIIQTTVSQEMETATSHKQAARG